MYLAAALSGRLGLLRGGDGMPDGRCRTPIAAFHALAALNVPLTQNVMLVWV
jgi:hypothetical protein